MTLQREPDKDLPMLCCSSELSIKAVLSDSMVKAVMAADGVDPQELEAMLVDIARQRARSPGGSCRDGA
jgi:hypothetical protein